MDTTAAMDTALSANQVRFFVATEMNLPSAVNVRLTDAGEATWAQGTFRAIDATFGTLENIQPVTDGEGDQAPQLSMSFLPASSAGAAQLSSPSFQGSRIRLWLGVINAAGAVVADPYLMFDGELDLPHLIIDAGSRVVEMDCVSAFERLFSDDEGIRLNPSNHKSVWPGETGLDDITGIVRQLLWGPGKPLSSGGTGSPAPITTGGWGGVGGLNGPGLVSVSL